MVYKSMALDLSVLNKARSQRRAFTDAYMEVILTDKKLPKKKDEIDAHAPVYAMAALYTKKDLAGGNKRILDAWNRLAGADKKMTPKEAEKAKWTMRGWLRVYYLFHDKSSHFPGRLKADVQAKMEELFFNYGMYKSTMKRANTDYIWYIQDSENHHMMNVSNAYLALQAVYKNAKYKDKKLSDNHTVAEHVVAWEKYFTHYPLERAKNGLFVEISPTYGKWFVGEFVNMFEFAESASVRKAMENLLHLMWADWAVDQINGTRGGGKTRCYQGSYSQKGGGDSWDCLGKVLFGLKAWEWNSHGGLSTLALLTSRYELPEIVIDIALAEKAKEALVYQSSRPAKVTAKVKGGHEERGYWMDPKGGDILRTSYCTPDAIMGSWMLNRNISYAAINTQNRWQGVIFSSGENSRVFPQSLGLGNKKTYNQHLAVQHRNAMLVIHHPKSKQTGQMRVFFPKTIYERIVEKDGWVLVKEGPAWLGVRVLGAKAEQTKNYSFRQTDTKKAKESSRTNSEGFWLWPNADKPPLAFVLSRESVHESEAQFLAYLKKHEYSYDSGMATYTFTDDQGEKVKLQLSNKEALPKINGKTVNLNPKKVFDSPYLSSDRYSGIVTISKGKKKKVLDFRIEK